MQAAVLSLRLATLDERNARRRAIARRYAAGVRIRTSRWPRPTARTTSRISSSCARRHAPRCSTTWPACGIATDVHYPIPDHLQSAYEGPSRPSLPVTERLAREVLTLPCFPELTDAEVDAVIEACNAWRPD